eukprot:821887-Amphidinium_carterae.3
MRDALHYWKVLDGGSCIAGVSKLHKAKGVKIRMTDDDLLAQPGTMPVQAFRPSWILQNLETHPPEE